jgi:hypothetical protein
VVFSVKNFTIRNRNPNWMNTVFCTSTKTEENPVKLCCTVVYLRQLYTTEKIPTFPSPSLSSLCGRSNHREERLREKGRKLFACVARQSGCISERRRQPRRDLTSLDEHINCNSSWSLSISSLC